MGRPRKPTKLHLLQGTAQPCRMKSREFEPQIDAKMPDAPDWMPVGAAQEWGARVATTPWLVATDEPLFIGYCLLRDKIKRLVAAGEDPSPATWAVYRNYCQSFGFGPADRARVQVPVVEKPTNKFAKLGS